MTKRYHFKAISKSSVLDTNTPCTVTVIVTDKANDNFVCVIDEKEEKEYYDIKGKVTFDISGKELFVYERCNDSCHSIITHTFSNVELSDPIV